VEKMNKNILNNVTRLCFILGLLTTNANAQVMVPNCCSFTIPQNWGFGPLPISGFPNLQVVVIEYDGVHEECLFEKPGPILEELRCAKVQVVQKILDCANCTESSNFTSAQKSAKKASEDASYGTENVTRVGDPSIKQDCHGATLELPYRVDSIMDFVLIRGYQQTSDINEALFCTHDTPVAHSSYEISQGIIPVTGCNGQQGQVPVTMLTGKFGYGSRLKMPESKVNSIYNVG
jgi:hypothetical protein